MKLFGFSIHMAPLWRLLGELVPERIINPGFQSRLSRPVVLQLSDEQVELVRKAQSGDEVYVAIEAQLRTAPAGAIELCLPETLFLIRRHHWPTRDLAVLNQALRLELEKKTPFRAADVTWRVAADAADGGGLNATQYIIRNAMLQNLRAAATMAGVNLNGISLAKPSLSFIQYPARAKRMRAFWSSAGVAALAGVVALTAATTWLHYERTRAAVERLELQAAALREAAILARQSAEAQQTEAEARAALEAEIAQDRELLKLMADLTGAIPDTAWLVQLNISQSEIRMAGFASTPPADFLTAIDGLPDIAGARFGGPVIRDHREQVDRFEIIAIRGDSP